jgi:hypothetical protein
MKSLKEKECKHCKEIKPRDAFYTSRAGKINDPTCRLCLSILRKAKNSSDPNLLKQQRRANHLKSRYGITIEQYKFLLEKQNNCCAVCEKHQDMEKTNFHVDHDHITGEIRGLLCNYCNRMRVGRHRDGKIFRKIADYLEQGTGWFVPKKKKPVKRKPFI